MYLSTSARRASYLSRRQYPNGVNYPYYGNSGWYSYGRWALLGAIIFVALVAFFLFSCISSRRRRRQGAVPYRGTAWLGGQNQATTSYYGPGGANNTYGNNTVRTEPAAPPYSYGQNQNYYGQQNGVEMQQPANVYQPPRVDEEVYAPPAGPPPAKMDSYR